MWIDERWVENNLFNVGDGGVGEGVDFRGRGAGFINARLREL